MSPELSSSLEAPLPLRLSVPVSGVVETGGDTGGNSAVNTAFKGPLCLFCFNLVKLFGKVLRGGAWLSFSFLQNLNLRYLKLCIPDQHTRRSRFEGT